MRVIVLRDLMEFDLDRPLPVHEMRGRSDFTPARCGFTPGVRGWLPIDGSQLDPTRLTDCPGCCRAPLRGAC